MVDGNGATNFPKIVRLSVGGQHFETSIDTLRRDPSSMLAVMFSGRHNVTCDEDGRYFIDRDGTHFRYILNYLRDGNTYMPVDNQQLVDELYEEVCFYGIEPFFYINKVRQGNATKLTMAQFLKIVNSTVKPLQIPGVRLTSLNLSYLNLDNANMRGCDLNHCNVIEASFEHATLIGCNFSECNLRSASFRSANISKSNFTGALMQSVDLLRVVAKDCNFNKARLQKADMRDGDFESSNFTEASLFEANLERTNLQFCTLTHTNLNLANLTNLRGGLVSANANNNSNVQLKAS